MTQSNLRQPGGIQNLILDRKGDRSNEALSRDCGGRPTGNAIWKILQGELRGFPDVDTIQGLAKGLKVPAREVLHAYARSLGLDIGTDEEPDSLALPGAQKLPAEAQDTLITMSQTLLNAYGAGEGGDWGTGTKTSAKSAASQ
ncbi:hypothetical protein ACIQXM_01785 [Arthrobacter sp. NPDC097144]|uniref:hypothetical protein n=1 Tax=Arthrobacter sp. NPDC097144 TaxID=3363946 RepID=UPI00382F694B